MPSGTVVVTHLFVKKILTEKNLINHDISMLSVSGFREKDLRI